MTRIWSGAPMFIRGRGKTFRRKRVRGIHGDYHACGSTGGPRTHASRGQRFIGSYDAERLGLRKYYRDWTIL